MFDVKAMLQRQAEWQRTRASRTWAEKIRDAERMRDGVKALRKCFSPAGRTAGKPDAGPIQCPPIG